MSKVLLITGACRGMGVDFARAALAAGHQVVATGRRPAAVEAAIGAAPNLLAVQLDVTKPADAEAAVAAAVERGSSPSRASWSPSAVTSRRSASGR